MLIQILLAILLGIIAGTFTGLFPGIHINLVGAILISLATSQLSAISTIYFVIFIVSLAISHTFLDFIPSIFLGAPDSDTELSVLPGHEMLKEGLGYQAIFITTLGGLIGIFIFVIIAFPSIILIQKIYSSIKLVIPYLLIFISLSVISSETKKFKALFAFCLSGILGLTALNMGLKDPLLPMLSGLFGASTLLISIKEKTNIPKQKINEKIQFQILKPTIASIISSPLSIFLPALGSGQIAIIGNQLVKTDRRGFLTMLGATNVLTMCFSFLALYTISKTRTGAAVAIKELIGIPKTQLFILILIVILISGIISFFLSLKLSKLFVKLIERFDYSNISKITLCLLGVVVFFFSGLFGIIVYLASSLTGVYCISLGVRRTNLMGCLLIPTIFLYLL